MYSDAVDLLRHITLNRNGGSSAGKRAKRGFSMTKFTRALYSTTSLGVALALASPASAQTAAPAGPPAAAATPDDSSTIVVTGFRAALQSSTSTKKKKDQVVESVSAEDIGKLPDNSIGESIARLPGVTAQRTNGRASGIAIRGFGPDFSTTLLNGREQTSTNDSRGVEFDQYPSEIVSRVDIYKTPAASLVGQGLVGTIDIRTARPLDYTKRVIAIGARGSYADIGKLNSGSKDKGYRVYGTFIDRFADGRVGVALSGSYLDEPYQSEQFNAWGYNTINGNKVIGGSKSYVTSTKLKRYGVNATLQGKLSDDLIVTADGFYSHFNDDQILRGIELPLGFQAFGTTFDPATATARNGVFTSGTFKNVQGVIRNDVFERRANLYSGGLNAAYDGHNGWKGFLDFGYSRTNRNELSIESYSGTGYGNVPTDLTDTIGFNTSPNGTSFTHLINYSDPAVIKLTDPLGWGGSTVQAGYYNNRIVKDDLKQYRAELQHELGGAISAVKVGFNYTDRNKSLRPDESFVTFPNGQTEANFPAGSLLKPTNTGYLGLGPVVSYDPRQIISTGTLILRPNTSNDIPAKAYSIKERLLIPYIQADIKADVGGGTVLTGNVGVQAVHADQSSRGLAFANGVAVPVQAGAKYWDVLPSGNLALRFPSDFVIRLGAAREIQRPRLDDMRVAIGYGIDNSGPTPIIRGGGGNPRLRPYRANAADLTFEKYFAGAKGYLAAQFYYKQIKSFIYGGRTNFDYSTFPLPSGPVPPSRIGTLDSPSNTGKGKMYGGELAATLPFSIFTNALDGFGVTGGVGYTKTSIRDQNGNPGPIPGYSKFVANGTLFFEKYGFNARGSVRHRSSFLGDFTGFGGTPTRRTALPETVVDAQLGYDFQPKSSMHGLSLYLQGQNLTDEPFVSVDGGNKALVLDHQRYGRRFLAGFTYKF